jgi:hypothetical protein
MMAIARSCDGFLRLGMLNSHIKVRPSFNPEAVLGFGSRAAQLLPLPLPTLQRALLSSLIQFSWEGLTDGGLRRWMSS